MAKTTQRKCYYRLEIDARIKTSFKTLELQNWSWVE